VQKPKTPKNPPGWFFKKNPRFLTLTALDVICRNYYCKPFSHDYRHLNAMIYSLARLFLPISIVDCVVWVSPVLRLIRQWKRCFKNCYVPYIGSVISLFGLVFAQRNRWAKPL